MSRKSDISQGTMDDLTLKVINYLTTSVKKVPFYAKNGVKQLANLTGLQNIFKNLTLNVLQSCQIYLLIHTF